MFKIYLELSVLINEISANYARDGDAANITPILPWENTSSRAYSNLGEIEYVETHAGSWLYSAF